MKIINYILLISSMLIAALSCRSDDGGDEVEPVFSKTVLIYMAADNNLSRFSYTNIDAIMNNSLDKLKDGKLLIYYDRRGATPELIEIYQENNQMKRKTIKLYEEHNSASDKVLSEVIKDAFSLYDSDSHGLILWSHGTSWLPSLEKGLTRSFGQDGTDEMELFELKRALPDNFFDFILFDACLMSSIEVCVELKDKAKYIVASPSEIFAEGFPYSTIVEDLFSDKALEEQLKSVCDSYFSYYSTKSDYYNAASISLVKTKKLNELTLLCKRLLNNRAEEITNMDVKDIQVLHYLKWNIKILFDFEDFFNHLSIDDADLQYLNNLLKDIVVYKKCTAHTFSTTVSGYIIPISTYSGLSIYIPRHTHTALNNWYYANTDWGGILYNR